MANLLLIVTMLVITACGLEVRDKNSDVASLSIKELIVESEFKLPMPKERGQKSIFQYDRIVLGRGSFITTGGQDVRLEIGELVSDQGTIQTFAEGQKAEIARDGRSGGKIELVVGRASGKLHLELRGEDGGNGVNGKDPDESLRGTKGYPGANAIYSGSYDTGGHNLQSPAQNGGRGGPGLPGFPGGNGGRGGNSGSASIKILEASEFDLSVQKIPGLGGVNGVGGKGGPGGFGGDPGKDLLAQGASRPIYTSPGPQGAEGPAGPNGNAGAGGEVEKLCQQFGVTLMECN